MSWKIQNFHCGLCPVPGNGVTCGLSFLLVYVPAPRVFSGSEGFPAGPSVFPQVLRFSCGSFGFPPFIKTNIPNFSWTWMVTVDNKSHLVECPLLNPIIIVIIFITITVIFITIIIVDCRLHRHCYGNGYGQCYRYSYHCCGSCRYNVNIIYVIVTYVIVSITKC